MYPSGTVTVTEGSSTILQCMVKAGIPSPVVTWERSNGQPFGRAVEQLSNAVLR